MVCMLATLSTSLLSGKGRGDWEALEGLHLGVGSLEGSLGLLSRDFRPRTGVNPSSSIEGVTEEVEVEAVPCCRGRGQFPSRSLRGCSLLFIPDLFFPRDVFMAWRCVCTSLTRSCSSFATHLHGNCFRDFRWRTLLSSYDVIIFLFQSVESKSLQEGGPHLFESFSCPTLLGGLKQPSGNGGLTHSASATSSGGGSTPVRCLQ